MEVAHADIQKRLRKPYGIVLRDSRQELGTRVEVFQDVLMDRQRALLRGMVEYGYRNDGLLEIRRSWFVKYNKPVYYQPSEFHDVLRKAKYIIVPKGQSPDFIDSLKELLNRISATEPRVVTVCPNCMRDRRLTVLSKRNAVKISSHQVLCGACSKTELRTDLKAMGIKMSKPMLRHMERQLLRVKSLPRILDLVDPNFDPTSDPEITKVDTLSRGEVVDGRKIGDLQIPQRMRDMLIEEGFDTLLPVQEKVVRAGLLKGEDLLIVSSTSSGKTMVGEFAGVPKALDGKKMIYLSPLVALTNEKYEVFRKRYKKLGLRVGIRVGMSRLEVGEEGKPIVDTDVEKSDIICATYEALDLLLRSGETRKLGEIGTIVVDEIQNLADSERGPELDGILSRLRFYAPNAQILALSATVGSPDLLAKDLNLELVNYTGRPVTLERHVVFARNEEAKRSIIRRLVLDEFRQTSSSGNKGQSIVFTFSRRRAHSISDWMREHGVRSAVYHGGLSYSHRRSIEYSYGKQRYPCVITTAALGAGVDLPASQVIFETLAMGAHWITTAEFEQMLGRAGRLGKHDRGKVYLLIEPERKYHSGQDLTEDQVATRILEGEIEDVEPFANKEASAEQILATICSTGLVDLKAVARIYLQMLSASVAPSEAMKHLVRNHMIRVKSGEVHPTPLGRATSVSFLSPSEGYEVAKLTDDMDVLDIAIKLDPLENIYLSSKLQAEVNQAFRTHMPTRLFSGAFMDMTDVGQKQGGASRLPQWVFELFGKWGSTFFTCECKDFPECDHPKIEIGKWIVKKRKEGMNPSGISSKMREEFELWAYPGDIYSWLDSVIHNLKAVQRIADVRGLTDLNEEIDSQIEMIERPLKK
ncbi:DEAD/DEAH box helicase [Candidatus Thorarchaeota archaeon]|nr:MAG: DEAD/DEAH box helicase [Candidatus Thorarchaeota archaeon]